MLKKLIFFLALPLAAQQSLEPTVRMITSLGVIDVSLYPDLTPLTVANFMTYVNSGAYKNTIFHRLVPGFVLQGGGYTAGLPPTTITTNAAVQNEFNLSNLKWTIAMAKVSGDPNSATDQWFFNLANNGGDPNDLDTTNGGFTVFGQVANTTGQTVITKIANSQILNYDGATFATLPVTANFNGTLTLANEYTVSNIVQIPTAPVAGFVDAASYAKASAGISPGQILAVFGLNMGPAQLTGLTVSNGVVSSALATTSVYFGGTAGAMLYSSTGQLSVIVPYNVAGKSTVQVTVGYQGYQTGAITLPVVATTPGIFTLTGQGTGDAAIVNNDTGAVVTTANPASVGDNLLLYAEGYGVTTQTIPDGQIIGSTLPVPMVAPVLFIDGTITATQYAGGAPAEVNGVLQVNFQVPKGLAPGSHQIQIQAGTATSLAANLQTK